MFKYLANSDISVRININPRWWNFIPFATLDKPTVLFPKRRTLGFGWLFLQVFIDVDNGKTDFSAYQDAMFKALDNIEMKDEDDKLETSISRLS